MRLWQTVPARTVCHKHITFDPYSKPKRHPRSPPTHPPTLLHGPQPKAQQQADTCHLRKTLLHTIINKRVRQSCPTPPMDYTLNECDKKTIKGGLPSGRHRATVCERCLLGPLCRFCLLSGWTIHQQREFSFALAASQRRDTSTFSLPSCCRCGHASGVHPIVLPSCAMCHSTAHTLWPSLRRRDCCVA